MKTPPIVMIALPCLLGMSIVHAQDQTSMLGIWKADLPAMSPRDPSLSRQMLRVTTLTGGYLFHMDIQSGGGEVDVILPIIPDGKTHVEQTDSGPIESTCQATDAKTIDCRRQAAGLPSQVNFVLSPDGSTLTQTDVNELVHEHHAAQAGAATEGARVSQDPVTGEQEQTRSQETRVVVYRRQ